MYTRNLSSTRNTSCRICACIETPLSSISHSVRRGDLWVMRGFSSFIRSYQIIWITLFALNIPVYSAAFIHRHQVKNWSETRECLRFVKKNMLKLRVVLSSNFRNFKVIVSPDSSLKLSPFAQVITLALIAGPSLTYGYAYYVSDTFSEIRFDFYSKMEMNIFRSPGTVTMGGLSKLVQLSLQYHPIISDSQLLSSDWEPSIPTRMECMFQYAEIRKWGLSNI